MSLYPASERAMKIQEGSQWKDLVDEAAEILGISPRSMQRWKQRYQEQVPRF
ncbi:MAG TPA: helix-turn-helix domain-containing protein [Terriglobia bacterium]|nr:helix-turn-helix domain-containing protein [Terriglobia bacterium]